jgi:CMP-N,N'-diacetyllegionaminic acid synthase
MFRDKRVLAIVPARGGSKGIKLKNLRSVGGVSLVVRAAHVASQCNFIDRAVVSTDHAQIARVAVEAGLAAPFLRPDSLSGDRIGDWDVLVHALRTMETLDGTQYDIVLMLQPTSPSRTPQHVRNTVTRLVEGGFDAVWTVSETDSKSHPLKQLVINSDGHLDWYDPAGATIIARQQLTPVYHRNGIAYAITRSCLLEQNTIKGARTGAVAIDEPVINIDTEYDLELGNFLLSRQLST